MCLFGGHIVLYNSWLAGTRIKSSFVAKRATSYFFGQKTGKSVRCTLKLGKSSRCSRNDRGLFLSKRTGFSRNIPSHQSENIMCER